MPAISARLSSVVLALLVPCSSILLQPGSAIAAPLPAPAAPAVVRAAPAATARTQLSPAKTTVPAGTVVALHSYVTVSDKPLPGVDVAYDVRRGDGSWTYLKTVQTNRQGRAVIQRTQQSGNVYRARFLGNARHAAATSPLSYVSVKGQSFGQRVVQEAARHAGKPYRYGAVGPNSFDCSGFTRYVYGRLGKSLPHNSGAQYNATRRIPRSQLQPGDLVFNGDGSVHHVGIYAGNGMYWHSPQSGKTVSRDPMPAHYVGGRV